MRGRVRLHAVKKLVSAGVEADGGRRKSLSEKGWARRSIVVHGLGPSERDGVDDLGSRVSAWLNGGVDRGLGERREVVNEGGERRGHDGGGEGSARPERQRVGDAMEIEPRAGVI